MARLLISGLRLTSVKRSDINKSLLVCEKFQENVLLAQINIVNHYNHLKKRYCETDQKFLLKGQLLQK